jgi:ATP-dependent DNA helicase RecG
MKMFNLINIGERSGSGVPNIFNTWNDQGWKESVIEERFDPDRTTLTLEFIKKTRKKTSKEDKIGNKTRTNMLKIEKYLQENGESKTNTIAEHLGLSLARTRKILSQMDSLEAIVTNTNRRYRLKNNSN